MTSTERRVVLRLPHFANKGGRIREALGRFLTFHFHPDGEDLVVFSDDPGVIQPAPLFVTRSQPVELQNAEAPSALAAELQKAIERPDEKNPPPDLKVLGGFGLLSDLRKASLAFFFSPRSHLIPTLQDVVIPTLTSSHLSVCLGVVLHSHAHDFYRLVSAPKFFYLLQEHEANFELVGEKAIEQGLYRNLLPTPFEPREMVEILNLFPPYIAGITLTRGTSSLFAYKERILALHLEAFRGIAGTLQVDPAPLTSKGEAAWLGRQRYDGEALGYLDLAIDASNRYWEFLTRPTNWIGIDQRWDALRQLKAISVGRLLLADVAAIALTSSMHAKNRLAFDFCDKLANFCIATLPDAEVKEKIPSLEARCAGLFLTAAGIAIAVDAVSEYRRDGGGKISVVIAEFGRSISKNLERDYAAMHSEVGQRANEKSVLQIVRTLRNLSHGTFLKDDPFVGVFAKANAHFPADMWRLPWLYTLALGLQPTKFISDVHKALPKLKEVEVR